MMGYKKKIKNQMKNMQLISRKSSQNWGGKVTLVGAFTSIDVLLDNLTQFKDNSNSSITKILHNLTI